jgi:cholesterol oxidase
MAADEGDGIGTPHGRRAFVKGVAAAGVVAAAPARARSLGDAGEAQAPPATAPAASPRARTGVFDVAVIGSGFGGAAVACRLAEAGYRVVVLERGRRWTRDQYPRKADDAWTFDVRDPARHNGWLDIRPFKHVTVVAGAGVGGGSLHYANVSINAQPDLFREGWPPEITLSELEPYYVRVKDMLKSEGLPHKQWNPRTKLFKEAADKAGWAQYWRQVDLAVSFDHQYEYDGSAEPNPAHTTWRTNEHGVQQGTCVHLGHCVIGCDVDARNTLATNYIPRAERFHADVRPLHVVRGLRPQAGGYTVDFERIVGAALVPGSVTARLVVVSAGSLGSTELLLHCRDTRKTLPLLSRQLGRGWCTNTNWLTPATHTGPPLHASRGPEISSAIDFFNDHHYDGQKFIIEDGGVPNFGPLLAGTNRYRAIKAFFDVFGFDIESRQVMPWFAQGRDQARGELRLRRTIFGLLGPHKLDLDWKPEYADGTVRAIVAVHKILAAKTGGTPTEPLLWDTLKAMVTPHPLGGCGMGRTAGDGVVDHKGEVFGYPGLFVSDGSIVPRAIGHNPSKTITALGERIAEHIVKAGR